MMWTMSLDGAVTFIDPEVQALRGFSSAQAVGQTIEEMWTPSSADLVRAYLAELRVDAAAGDRQHEGLTADLEVRRADGVAVRCSVELAPFHDRDGSLVGVVGIAHDADGRRRSEELLERARRDVAQANRNLTRLLRARSAELSAARTELKQLREALIPSDVPQLDGLDVAIEYRPAEHAVAGDFYLVAGSAERSVIVLGDMQGHGIAAARDATFARAVISSVLANASGPGAILELANRLLCEAWAEDDRFLSAACLVHDPQARTITWALAGHPSPIALAEPRSLDGDHRGLPLGVLADATFATQVTSLAVGDGLLLYTDGVTEARSGETQFGEERLLDAVRAHRGAPGAAVVRAVADALDAFTGGELSDDVCLMALRPRA
ncbi:unannotated protein [freshwater metagenome]|uniref:Unannotated protein n=1 Tax=freshwater metagenome TaxID=449393 RepID=A0A6J7HSH0_9ZZZZ|nr:SpoIIE family protein phosphatase [Actinomycetota bacterium]